MKKFVTADGNLRYQSVKHLLTITNELWKKVNMIAEECGVVNLEFKKEEWMKEPKKIFSASDIVTQVKKMFNVDPKIKSRKPEVIHAKFATLLLLKNYTYLSLREMGKYTGAKEHTTAMSGIKSGMKLMGTNDDFKARVVMLESILNQERQKQI
jgi:chromosomal replication initiation ATPase DnaA